MLPSTINLGSGKDFRAEVLNVDIDDTWRPDVVIDLSAVDLGPEGVEIDSRRFGKCRLAPSQFDAIVANDVLEHVPNLVALMTNCLKLLRVGGQFRISVPFDLSYGAWQDPTHVRTFNERSWLYYSDWFWYLGWRDARFVVDKLEYVLSPLGQQFQARGMSQEEIARTPRAVDSLSVTLRKAELSAADREALAYFRDRKRPLDEPAPAAPAAGAPAAPVATASAEALHRHCLWVVTPPNYAHSSAFDDVAALLGAGFAALGGSAPVVHDPSEFAGRAPIVLGPHLLGQAASALPAGSVLFNFEQIAATGTPWITAEYMALLGRYPLLDYSLANIAELGRRGLTHAKHLPIRGMPGLNRIAPAPEKDIDVLFYGSMNERRTAVIEGLRAAGLSVASHFGVYGPARNALVARAKVVLNVHFYDTSIFESVRVLPLMNCGACVVSEGRFDDPDCADIADGLLLTPYDRLVDICAHVVKDAGLLQELSRRAEAVAVRRTQADILKAVLLGG